MTARTTYLSTMKSKDRVLTEGNFTNLFVWIFFWSIISFSVLSVKFPCVVYIHWISIF